MDMFSQQIGCARWSLVSPLSASSTSIKWGGSLSSPVLRSVARVPMFCIWPEFPPCALCVFEPELSQGYTYSVLNL